MQSGCLTPCATAVLAEISAALERFTATGQPYTLYINKMALTPTDRTVIHDFLGIGQVKIQFVDTAEPAEWLESGISGVWYGVFYDHSKRPILETIEICDYPKLACAQTEDIIAQSKRLREALANNLNA